MKDLENKVAVITGGTSAIGIGTAILFTQMGAKILMSDTNEELLNEACKLCLPYTSEKNLLQVVGDITDNKVRDRIVSECLKKFGKIDVLINNEGISKPCNIFNLNLEDYDMVMNVNARSVISLTQKCLASIIENKGCIVNVSSILSTLGVPGSLFYCMSKGALDQFTRCLALELASKQVRVNSVNPAMIRTPLFNFSDNDAKMFEDTKAVHPLGRTVEPVEVAHAIAYLASDKASFTTGQTLFIDGGCLINNAFWRSSFAQ